MDMINARDREKWRSTPTSGAISEVLDDYLDENPHLDTPSLSTLAEIAEDRLSHLLYNYQWPRPETAATESSSNHYPPYHVDDIKGDLNLPTDREVREIIDDFYETWGYAFTPSFDFVVHRVESGLDNRGFALPTTARSPSRSSSAARSPSLPTDLRPVLGVESDGKNTTRKWQLLNKNGRIPVRYKHSQEILGCLTLAKFQKSRQIQRLLTVADNCRKATKFTLHAAPYKIGVIPKNGGRKPKDCLYFDQESGDVEHLVTAKACDIDPDQGSRIFYPAAKQGQAFLSDDWNIVNAKDRSMRLQLRSSGKRIFVVMAPAFDDADFTVEFGILALD